MVLESFFFLVGAATAKMHIFEVAEHTSSGKSLNIKSKAQAEILSRLI